MMARTLLVFFIACGLAMALFAGPPDRPPAPTIDASTLFVAASATERRPETSPTDLTLTGLEHADDALRALDQRNYSDARDHMRHAREALSELLTQRRIER